MENYIETIFLNDNAPDIEELSQSFTVIISAYTDSNGDEQALYEVVLAGQSTEKKIEFLKKYKSYVVYGKQLTHTVQLHHKAQYATQITIALSNSDLQNNVITLGELLEKLSGDHYYDQYLKIINTDQNYSYHSVELKDLPTKYTKKDTFYFSQTFLQALNSDKRYNSDSQLSFATIGKNNTMLCFHITQGSGDLDFFNVSYEPPSGTVIELV